MVVLTLCPGRLCLQPQVTLGPLGQIMEIIPNAAPHQQPAAAAAAVIHQPPLQQQQQQQQQPLQQQQHHQQQLPTTPLERAQLLECASEAAAAAAYAAGAGPFHFTTDAGQTHTVRDMLPSALMQLTGDQLLDPEGAAPFQPWSALGFWNDESIKDQPFLRPQPTSRQRFARAADGQQVTVSLAYNAPGKRACTMKSLGGNLGLSSASITCRVSTKLESQKKAQKLAEVEIKRHLVGRRQPGTANRDHPHWRSRKDDWEVGCVALYEFTGTLKKVEPEGAKLRPLAAVPAGASNVTAAAAAAAAPQQGPAAAVAGGEAGGAAAAPGLAPQAHAGAAGGLQQPAGPHYGPAGDAVPLFDDADGSIRELLAVFAAEGAPGACSPPSSLLDGLESDAEDAAAGDADAVESAGGVGAAAAVAAAAAGAAGAAGGAGGVGAAAPAAAAAGAATGAADLDETDSEDDDTGSLPDLGPDPVALHLLAVDDVRATLKHRLLELAAGVYGQGSMAVLGDLLPSIQAFNLQEAAGVPVVVTDVAESWFLKRSTLHLLVSTVCVWGPAGDVTPQGLSDEYRTQLLDGLCGNPKSLKVLLQRRNVNRAPPFFTACHFANLAVTKWLISRPELTFKVMLQPTKLGKLFYHILSTQAAEAKTVEERQRFESAMVLTLTALADRAQRWLDRLSPEQRQQHKQKIRLSRQQRSQRHQTRLCAEALAADTQRRPDLHGSEAAAAAAAAVSQQPAAAATGAAAGAAQVQQGAMSTALVPAAAAAGAGGGGGSSISGLSPLDLSEDARWFLEHYVIFHTQWHSRKLTSPRYNGQLLEEVAQVLYGFSPRRGYE